MKEVGNFNQLNNCSNYDQDKAAHKITSKKIEGNYIEKTVC